MAKRFQDKYYTPNNVVKAVLKVVEKEIMPLNKFSRIIEPSAGAGAFLKQLPNTAIGYDIAPEFDGIIQGDYLKQDIPYMKNSIVIGNPPFGNGHNFLYKKFIKKSLGHSDYVAFILHGNLYKKNIHLEGIKLIQSYMLPEVEYSGVRLKCCFNIYGRGEEKTKKIKGVTLINYARNENSLSQKKLEEEYKNKKCDYRVCRYGKLKILDKFEKIKVKETKISFNKKRNFKPILEKFLNQKNGNCISVGVLSLQDIIDLIYDTYPDLRAN